MTDVPYDADRNMLDYAHLTRAAIEYRLRLAENACVLAGWTVPNQQTRRAKAALQAWMAWSGHVGGAYSGPDVHPGLAAAEEELAAERDRVRAAAVARLATSDRIDATLIDGTGGS